MKSKSSVVRLTRETNLSAVLASFPGIAIPCFRDKTGPRPRGGPIAAGMLRDRVRSARFSFREPGTGQLTRRQRFRCRPARRRSLRRHGSRASRPAPGGTSGTRGLERTPRHRPPQRRSCFAATPSLAGRDTALSALGRGAGALRHHDDPRLSGRIRPPRSLHESEDRKNQDERKRWWIGRSSREGSRRCTTI